MANEILQKVGTQIRFCVAASFNPAAAGTNWTIGTPTDVAITLAELASTAARQSAKADLGATRAASFAVLAAVDFTGETPVQNSRVDFYWAPSTHATPATGNVGGQAGADAAFPDGSVLGSADLADLLKWCQFIGSLVTHNGASVQNGFVGVFSPASRYGSLVVVNNSGDAFENDDVENHVVFNPIVDEVQ